jgi:CobQ-like glutamine amidotransferase family enzyme/UDP-N-acetylmuramyl tripeptide synthase
MVAEAGWPVVHNATGSNLPRGLLTTLMAHAGLLGDLRVADGALAILETDEAAVARVLRLTGARVLVVTNLFRDQLDRYGEVDAVRDRWRTALEGLPAEVRPTLVLDVDDPAVAGLASCAGPAGMVPFGVSDRVVGQAAPDHASDAKQCPTCGSRLTYDRVTYGHLGAWRCAAGHARPLLEVAADGVRLGQTGAGFDLVIRNRIHPVRLAVPGLYNVYNAVAAAATAHALRVGEDAVIAAIGGFRGAFGRFERLEVEGRTVVVVLAKNPVGMNEALRTIASGGEACDLLLALNDLDADGRDISWIWDADFEVLAGRACRVTVAGRRAADLAMRLAYAGVGAPDDPHVSRDVIEGIAEALDRSLGAVPVGGVLAAVVTYTAMLELRQVLVSRGHATAYWDDAAVVAAPGAADVRAHAAPTVTGFTRPTTDSSSREAGRTLTRVSPRVVRIGHLYADVLNLYADRGNVMSLRRRCDWRGIGFEVVPLGIGDRIVPGTVDMVFIGGGQDADQSLLADDLFRVKADGVRGLVSDGVPVLAVCGSYQLLGHYYDPASGPRIPGLGIFDLHTAHPGPETPRCIGNVVVEWEQAPPSAPRTLVGFENHGGRTWLGRGAIPFARVVSGYGNNGADRTEGIVLGNAIGTYMHGSLLPKNPHLADRLISLALDPTGSERLEPLDDSVEWRAHKTIIRRVAPSAGHAKLIGR